MTLGLFCYMHATLPTLLKPVTFLAQSIFMLQFLDTNPETIILDNKIRLNTH